MGVSHLIESLMEYPASPSSALTLSPVDLTPVEDVQLFWSVVPGLNHQYGSQSKQYV